jgi:hypothetical protein
VLSPPARWVTACTASSGSRAPRHLRAGELSAALFAAGPRGDCLSTTHGVETLRPRAALLPAREVPRPQQQLPAARRLGAGDQVMGELRPLRWMKAVPARGAPGRRRSPAVQGRRPPRPPYFATSSTRTPPRSGWRRRRGSCRG